MQMNRKNQVKTIRDQEKSTITVIGEMIKTPCTGLNFHGHRILDYNFGKQTQMPLLRKFCLLCETIDDQRSSTRRLHDVDDLCKWFETWDGTWVNVVPRASLCFDKHITLTTQIWIEWPVSYKLMSETPWFPQSKGSRYCLTQWRNFVRLCDLFLNLWN